MADQKAELSVEEKKDIVFEETLGKDVISELPLPARIACYLLMIFFVAFGLYFFLVSIAILGEGFKLLAGTSAGEIFNGVENPLAGLMIGILATVLVQSSSTTTALITVLVGESIIPFPLAIPMIMGANIGTSVTNTIVAFSMVTENEMTYERGFAGATVHDMFNFCNVILLLPLELLVNALRDDKGGLLAVIAKAVAPDEDQEADDSTVDNIKEANKVKEWTSKITARIVETDKKVIYDISQGRPDESACDDPESTGFSFQFGGNKGKYPYCDNGVVNQTILAEAQEAWENAPILKSSCFGTDDETQVGIYTLLLSLFLLVGSLTIIVKTLSFVVRGPGRKYVRMILNIEEALPVLKTNKVLSNLNVAGYLGIGAGAAITVFVQSSSITTSILTPMVASNLMTLENMFPYTLGANIGTTSTALLTAFAKGKQNSIQIAFVHLFFNIVGVLVFFPAPFMRAIPLGAARFLGKATYVSKAVPLMYLVTVFLVYPGLSFGISAGFSSGNAGGKAGASILLILVLGAHAVFAVFYFLKGGRTKLIALVEEKRFETLNKRTQMVQANTLI